jgi:hypothetical protein
MFVHLQTTYWRVSKIRAMLFLEAQELAEAPTQKRSKEKT